MARGRVLIGTSGYGYRDWRGRFYPRGLPAREWLPFYARHVPRRAEQLVPRRALEKDAGAIRAWQRQGRDVDVYVNNDWQAYAIRNARLLAGLVYGEGSGRAGRRKREPRAA